MSKLWVIYLLFHTVEVFLLADAENELIFTNYERLMIDTVESGKTTDADVFVNLRRAVNHLSERFLSVTIDSSLFDERWPSFDFRSVRLRTLARGLSPAYLRFGGNAADYLVFRKETSSSRTRSFTDWTEFDYDIGFGRKNLTQFYMTAVDFDNLNGFASDVGWRLVFDLDVLSLRDAKNRWNSTNAHDLLEYAVSQKYNYNMDLELGNEPNSFSSTVSAEQLAADFISLKAMLNRPEFTDKFKYSLIVGPAVSQPKPKTTDYLAKFLMAFNNTVDVITFHHYYMDGRLATIDNMTSTSVLDSLVSRLVQLRQTLEAVGHGDTPVALGETASCWHGGAEGLSDTYVAGFMWLDKLGLAALFGVDPVARQAFYHGHYALVDNEHNPNPDYWLTWIYKRLVGERVLAVQTSHSDYVRLYAHCTATHGKSSANGSVTLYGMNLHKRLVKLTFDHDLLKLEKHLYWLLPDKPGKLTAKFVSVSGKTLKLVDDKTFPRVSPTVVPAGEDVFVPGKSFGFIVIPDARAPACSP